MSRPTRCFTPSRSRSLTHTRTLTLTRLCKSVSCCVCTFPFFFGKFFFAPTSNLLSLRGQVFGNFRGFTGAEPCSGADGHRDVAIPRERAIEGGAILPLCWISQFLCVAGRKYGYHRKRPRDTVRRRFCRRKTVQRARKFHSTKYRTAKQRTSIRSFTSASSYHS